MDGESCIDTPIQSRHRDRSNRFFSLMLKSLRRARLKNLGTHPSDRGTTLLVRTLQKEERGLKAPGREDLSTTVRQPVGGS
jgi:hypothetical protein